MPKIILGILIGLGLSALLMWGYRTYCLQDCIINSRLLSVKNDTSLTALQSDMLQMKLSNGTFEEKISSMNKRMDDFLVFGGIVITLLLGITVSIYLKTETEVGKHFKENFNDHIEQMTKYKTEAAKLVGEMQVNVDGMKNSQNSQQNQTPSNDGNSNTL